MELSGREVWVVDKHAGKRISVLYQMLLGATFLWTFPGIGGLIPLSSFYIIYLKAQRDGVDGDLRSVT